jgi:hypothetical protein
MQNNEEHNLYVPMHLILLFLIEQPSVNTPYVAANYEYGYEGWAIKLALAQRPSMVYCA